MERVWGLLLVLLLSFLPGEAWAEVREYTLTVTEGTLNLKGLAFPVWPFNGVVPGPEIRVKEGERVRIRLKNRSGAYHTLTFHGLQVPFQMAGVPGCSQAPIGPGEELPYEFVLSPAAPTTTTKKIERGFES